jgi:hypothetical protein
VHVDKGDADMAQVGQGAAENQALAHAAEILELLVAQPVGQAAGGLAERRVQAEAVGVDDGQ